METQKTLNSQSNLEGKNGAGGIRLPDFRLYYKATVIKTILYWHKKHKYRSMEQDRKPRDKPHTYGQLVYDKGGKDKQWRKDSLFNKWYWENWTATCKRMKLEHSLTPYSKITSKQIKNQELKANKLKTLNPYIRVLEGLI